MINHDDKTLIEKIADGDEAAFSEIYFRFRNAILGFSYRMLNDRAAAEDITQEAFMFLVRKPEKFRAGEGSLKSFLCGVARNRILHHFREKGAWPESKREDLEDNYDIRDERAADPLKNVLNLELAKAIEESMAALPLPQREVVFLREIEELSYAEIAAITDAGVGQVKVRLHRGRKALAAMLTPYVAQKKEIRYEVL